MNTTSLTPGMLALLSMRCDTLMIGWTVNTNESMPQPMGRIAASHTPRTQVVHRHLSGAPEHLREVRREHPVRADRPEHVGLPGEYPVAGVSQHPAQPCVDVLRDPRERRCREGEDAAQDGEGRTRANPRLPTAFAIVSVIVAS